MSLSMRSRFLRLPQEERRRVIARHGEDVFRELVRSWRWTARPEQLPPDKLPNGEDWATWLIRTGRGWGKNRTGSEYVAREVEAARHEHLLFMGKDIVDARELMYEKGLMAGPYRMKPKREWPRWRRDGSEIVWPNGAKAKVFGAVDWEQARGHQASFGWFDEFAMFLHAKAIWEEVVMYNIRLNGPLGDPPRKLITTTPKRKKIMKRIAADPHTILTTGSTFDNEDNLAANFMREVAKFKDTTAGRQEIFGDQLDEVEGAWWTQDLIDQQRIDALPRNVEIIAAAVGVDPSGGAVNEVGIVAVLMDVDQNLYVVRDNSLAAKPRKWGLTAVMTALDNYGAKLVGEVNHGGDMVEEVLTRAMEDYNATAKQLALLDIEKVRASTGKMARAEPIHMLYERGKIWHVGRFIALEEEMCTYTGAPREDSPNRMDALVWGCTYLAAMPGATDLRAMNEGWADLAKLSKQLMMRGRR